MRILTPAWLLGAALAIPLATAASAAIVINIDKTRQQMSVSVDGTPRYLWPVSTGRPGYETPNGTFKANRMDAEHLSQEWDNAPMPHTIFFRHAWPCHSRFLRRETPGPSGVARLRATFTEPCCDAVCSGSGARHEGNDCDGFGPDTCARLAKKSRGGASRP